MNAWKPGLPDASKLLQDSERMVFVLFVFFRKNQGKIDALFFQIGLSGPQKTCQLVSVLSDSGQAQSKNSSKAPASKGRDVERQRKTYSNKMEKWKIKRVQNSLKMSKTRKTQSHYK